MVEVEFGQDRLTGEEARTVDRGGIPSDAIQLCLQNRTSNSGNVSADNNPKRINGDNGRRVTIAGRESSSEREAPGGA